MFIIFLRIISRITRGWATKKGLCPKAEKLYEEIMSLPLYYAMSDKDVEDVITAVKKIAAYYAV